MLYPSRQQLQDFDLDRTRTLVRTFTFAFNYALAWGGWSHLGVEVSMIDDVLSSEFLGFRY